MVTSKVELLVEWGTDGPSSERERTLEHLRGLPGVQSAELASGALVVESTLPSSQLLQAVQSVSGRRAVLQGFGERQSAVAQVNGDGGIVGVVRFQQAERGPLVVDGTVDGLTCGRHALRVHEAGDLSRGCSSLGSVYGGEGGSGELGHVTADQDGRATFRLLHQPLEIPDIIGRSLAVSTGPDDLTNGCSVDCSAFKIVGCGVIARSAGVFANPKRVCLCDGVTVWDERERPSAGRGRRADAAPPLAQPADGESCCCRKPKPSNL